MQKYWVKKLSVLADKIPKIKWLPYNKPTCIQNIHLNFLTLSDTTHRYVQLLFCVKCRFISLVIYVALFLRKCCFF
ncbi:hypothetical protein GDO78_006844 [Eleutherodactylus coqui]|uniref:Uncharacterized protein n=1 Tax=Eleutherodactylus coqui TaxID=57060 RepID=A0A8J6FFK6_ELECQ|nr:hypothetical protein GDO78_006844 [Eleutherodactylus coqui]